MGEKYKNKKCIFYDVYSLPSLKKIGEVKYDPMRTVYKWTGLLDGVGRIKDCDSREEAEVHVRDAYARKKIQSGKKYE